MSNPRLLVRSVVFYRPGPRWKPEIDFREQEGVEQHVRQYLKFHKQGKLELGGPFLMQNAMVAIKEASKEELETFVGADPAVQSSLLIFEMRPWPAAMEHQPKRIEEP